MPNFPTNTFSLAVEHMPQPDNGDPCCDKEHCSSERASRSAFYGSLNVFQVPLTSTCVATVSQGNKQTAWNAPSHQSEQSNQPACQTEIQYVKAWTARLNHTYPQNLKGLSTNCQYFHRRHKAIILEKASVSTAGVNTCYQNEEDLMSWDQRPIFLIFI